jgi:hypothetical protein
MLPVIDVIYNYEYASRLYRGTEIFEDVWRRIIGSGADFEALFETFGQGILQLIERYSGYAWAEYNDSTLPLYLVDSQPSFAQPLTLSIAEDPMVMLADAAYQLAHRNMPFGFTDEAVRQACYQLVTDKVMCDLGLQQSPVGQWDTRYKTIKEYLIK